MTITPTIAAPVTTASLMADTTHLKEWQWLDKLVQTLTTLVKKLPTTLPCGTKDSPITLNFSDLTYETSEGPYYMFNISWERIFQRPDDQKELLVIQGKYGLDVVLSYIAHFL